MKLERLFEIIYLLMNKRRMTARELAEYFEVSVRTIHRDVETLCMAGIPLYTQQGRNGGIALSENFVLNKSLLSKGEQEQILLALQGMQVTQAFEDSEKTIKKMMNIFGASQVPWIDVDLSGWSNSRINAYETVKQGILERRVLGFTYHGRDRAAGPRQVEPLQLWFKERTWYLRAFCRNRQAMRLFKLSRMRHIELLEERFEWREFIEEPKGGPSAEAPPMETLVMHIDAAQAYRVFDEFDEQEIKENEDGSFLITVCYMPDEWVYGMLLSFGEHVEVLQPPSVIREMQRRISRMKENYRTKQT